MGWKQELSVFGSYITYFFAAAIFLLSGHVKQFYQLAIGLAIIYAVVFPIRTVWFKNRPKKEPYHDRISKFTANTLISVHSARAVMLAFVLASYFSFKPLLLIILFSLGIASVAVSRVLLGKHRPVDVAFGLLIGVAISALVLNFI